MPIAATAMVTTASITASAKARCQLKATISADTGRGSGQAAAGRSLRGRSRLAWRRRPPAARAVGAAGRPGCGRRHRASGGAARDRAGAAARPEAGFGRRVERGLVRRGRERGLLGRARARQPRAGPRARAPRRGSSAGSSGGARAPLFGRRLEARLSGAGGSAGSSGASASSSGALPGGSARTVGSTSLHRCGRLGGRRHPLDQRVERLGEPQLVLDAPGAVAQVGAQPLAGGGGQLAVQAVADHPLGPLAPAAAGQRVPGAAQRLAAAGQRGAHLLVAQSELSGGLAALHLAQLHQREGVHRLGVQPRQPGPHVRAREPRIGGPGCARGQRAEGGVLHGSNIPTAGRTAPLRSGANTYPG